MTCSASATCRRRVRALCAVALAAAGASAKPAEPLPSRPVFHLQDPIDGLCLGPHGFMQCDTDALWTVGVASGRQSIVSFLHPSEEAKCLERVQTGKYDSKVRLASCKAGNTLKWNIKPMVSGAMVTSDDGKQCVARMGNFAGMQPCDFGYTALVVAESPLRNTGFFLAAKDGTCFDGVRFRPCNKGDPMLYWGAAVRFDSPKGEGYYSFFKFHQLRTDPGQKCLARESSKRHSPTVLADCAHWGAKSWALMKGRLTHDKGRACVKRDDKTGGARMVACSEGGTPITLTTPDRLRAYP
ncbi:hypothetical protein KFE25_009650 [Diacronema lutheri]|uniref:Ricin B lectin domain-containing protein n=1 Tax=Diacronema lutheri TaxID=2081491 RepID=A0A8J5Y668_DIALT|nr:hypothetical protein KFE25_009650 [Diacronema lutheri]